MEKTSNSENDNENWFQGFDKAVKDVYIKECRVMIKDITGNMCKNFKNQW